jgi:hypothetical protein
MKRKKPRNKTIKTIRLEGYPPKNCRKKERHPNFENPPLPQPTPFTTR